MKSPLNKEKIVVLLNVMPRAKSVYSWGLSTHLVVQISTGSVEQTLPSKQGFWPHFNKTGHPHKSVFMTGVSPLGPEEKGGGEAGEENYSISV